MRVVMVWRDNTDYARSVTSWLEDFRRRTGRELESMNPDTREGDSFVRIYDIVQYPTMIALSDDGREQKRWVGATLPMIDEVNFYTLDGAR